MANRGNGRPDDCPPWAWVLIQEVRESNRQSAEARKQSAEDRKQAAEDRSAIRATLERLDRSYGEMVRIHRSQSESFRVLAEVQVSMLAMLRKLLDGQRAQTKLLHQILRTLRVQANGRAGNGSARAK